MVVVLDTRYTRVERTRCANHTSLHTRVLQRAGLRIARYACLASGSEWCRAQRFTRRILILVGGPTGEMSSLGLRNCENGDCIVGSRARYKVYTGGADPLRQSHVLAHTRATPAFTKRHDNVQPPLGARARGDAELAIGHREGVIDGYRSRRQRRRAQSEPVHASGQHFTRATLAPQ